MKVYIINIPVHAAPPYLSLTSTSNSSGLASKRIPGALGVYRISHTTRKFRHLVGYSLLDDRTVVMEELFFFKDYRRPSYEVVSKVPFSRAGKTLKCKITKILIGCGTCRERRGTPPKWLQLAGED